MSRERMKIVMCDFTVWNRASSTQDSIHRSSTSSSQTKDRISNVAGCGVSPYIQYYTVLEAQQLNEEGEKSAFLRWGPVKLCVTLSPVRWLGTILGEGRCSPLRWYLRHISHYSIHSQSIFFPSLIDNHSGYQFLFQISESELVFEKNSRGKFKNRRKKKRKRFLWLKFPHSEDTYWLLGDQDGKWQDRWFKISQNSQNNIKEEKSMQI